MLTKFVGGFALLTMLVLQAACDRPAPPRVQNSVFTLYYVAQEDAQASDDNDGSEATPWKTIARGLKTLKPGDTLYVKKGVYREEIVLSRKNLNKGGALDPTFTASGKDFAKMTSIMAWPGAEVVLVGSDVVTGWKLHKGNVYVKEDWTVNSQQAFCDGKRLQQIAGTMTENIGRNYPNYWGRKGEGLTDMEAGSFFCDLAGKKLYVWLPDGGDPNKHTIEVSVRRGLVSLDADYVRIGGFKMRHSTTSSTCEEGAVNITGANNILENCEIIGVDYIGLNVEGQCNTIIGCKSNYNGARGIGGGGWGHRIINCETSYNNYRNITPGWDGSGIKIIPFAHDILISGHLAAYNGADGIWFDSGNYNITIQNSVCHNNKREGIFYEISERGTFLNNICYENGQRGIYLSNSSDCQVLHNVVYRNGMSGVGVNGIKRSWATFDEGKPGRIPARNNVIWGNIFYDNCVPEFIPAEILAAKWKNPDGSYMIWDTHPELFMPEDFDINTGNVSDYNIYYRSPKRVMSFWKGWISAQFKDLADWQAKTGYDMHSIVADPLFRDAKKYDFRPSAKSPAINFVRARMCAGYQMDGERRPRLHMNIVDHRFTAGPFEIEPETKP